jgi:hypothetical protein
MDLSSLGVGSLGLWTRRQALTLVSAAQVDHLVATRTWQVLWPGVYADGGCPLDVEQAALAAVLAAGGEGQPVPFGERDPTTGQRRKRLVAVASGRTAARVHGFPLIDDDDPATGACERVLDDVARWTSGRDQRWGQRRLVLHQPRFEPGDLVGRSSGLWITSPLRTLVDCARLLSHEALSARWTTRCTASSSTLTPSRRERLPVEDSRAARRSGVRSRLLTGGPRRRARRSPA